MPATGHTARDQQTQAERTEASAAALRRALIELIAEQGYAKTTAAEICARAGYSRSMVRDRYGSKDKVLEALQLDYEQHLLTPAPEESQGLVRILAATDRLESLAADRPTILRAVLVASFEAAGAAPMLRPLAGGWAARLDEWHAAELRRGQEDGSVSTRLDPEAEAARFLREAVGDAYLWVIGSLTDYPGRIRVWRAEMENRYAPGPGPGGRRRAVSARAGRGPAAPGSSPR